MTEENQPGVLAIKKYSNRRFYDATRSRHVTLSDMHDVICQGYELKITDGTSGGDITNMVLTQIILERDPPKLEFFPANVLHQVIRTQKELLGSVAEQFFAQVLESHKTSQEQWFKFVRNTLGVNLMSPANPMDWTRSVMEALTPTDRPKKEADPDSDAQPTAEMEALRRQVEQLTRQMHQMAQEARKADPA